MLEKNKEKEKRKLRPKQWKGFVAKAEPTKKERIEKARKKKGKTGDDYDT